MTIRVSDRDVSERFYEMMLSTLGIEQTHRSEPYAEWKDFSLASADEGNRVTRRLHVAFVAPSRVHADEFWRVGTAAGYRDDGAPRPRPEYGDDYYGAFLLDPDGNSAEAVHRSSMRVGGVVDHLWIRVADVDAAKRFYETVGPYAGFRLRRHIPERAQFVGETGTFSVVLGPPTEALHMAFPARENATVDAFHRIATEAGYDDNGGPGERSVYHPGYYGAYVLDPDGNNIEVVNHNRP